MTIGARQLRDWMQRRSYKQFEAAAVLGFTESFFSHLINGKRAPGREVAVRIEDITGIPVKAWSSRLRDKSSAAAAAGRG